MHRSMNWLVAGAAAALLTAGVAHAQCQAHSDKQTVALLELYTSEGCSSCPPADRWFSGIALAPTSAIALALHVDYWDRLGWKDRFASAGYTARQYEQMRRQQAAYVYTPQVLLQGRDFRQWGVRGEPASAVSAINARPSRAAFELVASTKGEAAQIDVHVSVPEPRDRSRARIVVALVQDHLTSTVSAGENAGRRLEHDHVVRQWHAAPGLDGAGELRERIAFKLPSDGGPVSVVAFAEDAGTGDVLQALALPLAAACVSR
jgi:hypothetical protein